jgi:hypothetical protein
MDNAHVPASRPPLACGASVLGGARDALGLAEPTGGSPVRAPAHAGFVLVKLAGGSFRVALDKELPMVDQGLGVGCVKGKGREQARVGGAPASHLAIS